MVYECPYHYKRSELIEDIFVIYNYYLLQYQYVREMYWGKPSPFLVFLPVVTILTVKAPFEGDPQEKTEEIKGLLWKLKG